MLSFFFLGDQRETSLHARTKTVQGAVVLLVPLTAGSCLLIKDFAPVHRQAEKLFLLGGNQGRNKKLEATMNPQKLFGRDRGSNVQIHGGFFGVFLCLFVFVFSKQEGDVFTLAKTKMQSSGQTPGGGPADIYS